MEQPQHTSPNGCKASCSSTRDTGRGRLGPGPLTVQMVISALTQQTISCCLLGPSVPTSGTLPEGQVDSLLSIISSQRERFRTRNQELEAVSPLCFLSPQRPQICMHKCGKAQAQGKQPMRQQARLDVFCAVETSRGGCATWGLENCSGIQRKEHAGFSRVGGKRHRT